MQEAEANDQTEPGGNGGLLASPENQTESLEAGEPSKSIQSAKVENEAAEEQTSSQKQAEIVMNSTKNDVFLSLNHVESRRKDGVFDDFSSCFCMARSENPRVFDLKTSHFDTDMRAKRPPLGTDLALKHGARSCIADFGRN